MKEPLQQSMEGNPLPQLPMSTKSAHAEHMCTSCWFYVFILWREVGDAYAKQGTQPYFENYFLRFRASMADEFLEQSLHFSSPTHLGCLALKAASLPSSFASQQLCHPAGATAQPEGRALAEERAAWPNLLQRANEDPRPSHTAQLLVCNIRILTNFKETIEHFTWDLNSQRLQQALLEERVLLLFHLPQSGTAASPADREMDLAAEQPVPSPGKRTETVSTASSKHTIRSFVCITETEAQVEESRRAGGF